MSTITATRQDAAAPAIQLVGEPVVVRGRSFDVEVRGSGSVELTRALLEWVQQALTAAAGMEGTILSANLARGTLDLRASVLAGSKSDAYDTAAGALARAMAAVGVKDVEVRRAGWRRGPVATAHAPAAVPSLA
jgi:hypothetical protein